MSRTATLMESALPWPLHERHRPEKTFRYYIIDRHYPEFLAHIAEQGKPLPYHVQKEFDEYLKCGRLEQGFLRVQCSTYHKERLVSFSCKRRGFCPSCRARRMAESAALLIPEAGIPCVPFAAVWRSSLWPVCAVSRPCRPGFKRPLSGSQWLKNQRPVELTT